MKKRTVNEAGGNVPQPIRATELVRLIHPRNVMRDIQNPNMLVPPITDAGLVPNLKFSFSDTSMILKQGGWSREITARELPVSTTIAGVNMSLTAGGVRELHWHKEAEWAYMLLGRARITAVDQNGRNFIADVALVIFGIFRLVFRIPFKDWNIVNFYSFSMMGIFLIYLL